MRVGVTILSACLAFPLLLLGMVTQPLFPDVDASPPPAVEAAALKDHVFFLSEQCYPRSFEQREKLEAAAVYIHEALKQTGARVRDQVYEVEGQQYRNILACYGPAAASGLCGADPLSDGAPSAGQRPAQEVIVVGAHYDSYGDTEAESPHEYSPDTHTPGADDNASGVAGLLELGRLFGENPPKRPVVLVAYSLEEPPHFRTEAMGSVAHARSLEAAGVQATAVIVLEMIGYFSNTPGSQHYPVPGMSLLYPDAGNFIGVVGRFQDVLLTRKVKSRMQAATDLPVYSINAVPLVPGIDFSDHRSYWGAGYSAVMITDTAFYRNTAYHTAHDTAGRLDYQRMAKVVQGVYAAVAGSW